jgi:hypothetical protein
MTLRTFTDKNGNVWNWEESAATVEALKNFHAGNYEGPLYAPHPDLNNENKTNTQSTDVG